VHALPLASGVSQTPAAQVPPAPHAVPSGCAGDEHTPVPGAHVPAARHAPTGLQTTGMAPVHTPAWQPSMVVQALPSLHSVASGKDGFEHTPVPGLQVPAAWH
jgi:hypothetical protein